MSVADTTGGDRSFLTTQWTVVQRAFGGEGDPDEARRALGALIAGYWNPVFAFVRRSGHAHEVAKDLTQGFFTSLIERPGAVTADPALGHFRSYLLGALKHYLANTLRAERAVRRGSGLVAVPLDLLDRSDAVVDDSPSPEAAFDRLCAEELIERAMARLERQLAERGRSHYFTAFRLSMDPRPPTYAEIARQLGVEVTDVTNYLHRARKAFRQALLAEVMPGASSRRDAERELADILRALTDA